MIWHSFMLNPYLYKDWAIAVCPSGAADCGLHWELLSEDLGADPAKLTLSESRVRHIELLGPFSRLSC